MNCNLSDTKAMMCVLVVGKSFENVTELVNECLCRVERSKSPYRKGNHGIGMLRRGEKQSALSGSQRSDPMPMLHMHAVSVLSSVVVRDRSFSRPGNQKPREATWRTRTSL